MKMIEGWFVSCVGMMHNDMVFDSGKTMLQVIGHFILLCYHLEISSGLVLLCHELVCVENGFSPVMDITVLNIP
jgi:hypothetical protein